MRQLRLQFSDLYLFENIFDRKCISFNPSPNSNPNPNPYLPKANSNPKAQ